MASNRPRHPGATDQPAQTSLEGLSVAGITRRRVGWVLAGVVFLWILVTFGRQVTEGRSVSDRADRLRASNAALAAEVEALEAEAELVKEQRFMVQQARGYRLGSTDERPFSLAPDAPDLPPDAPGSAARRVGAHETERTPLESWLLVLFGDGPPD